MIPGPPGCPGGPIVCKLPVRFADREPTQHGEMAEWSKALPC